MSGLVGASPPAPTPPSKKRGSSLVPRWDAATNSVCLGNRCYSPKVQHQDVVALGGLMAVNGAIMGVCRVASGKPAARNVFDYNIHALQSGDTNGDESPLPLHCYTELAEGSAFSPLVNMRLAAKEPRFHPFDYAY